MNVVWGTNKTEILDAADGATNGADLILGLDGNDDLYGLGGDDLLKGGGGADDLYGGAGFDTADYSDSTAGVSIDLHYGTAKGGTADGDTLFSIENLNGSQYDDVLLGDDGANTFTGLGGYDKLYGRDGNDILNGGDGNDALHGGAGADQLIGGDGFDTAYYTDSNTAVRISLEHHYAHDGYAEGDTFDGIESIVGSIYDDQIWGDDDYDNLEGYDGNDNLKGYGGDDQINGGKGQDDIFGMDGHDQLSGDDGNDHIYGLAQDDDLWGGAGNDTLVGGTGRDVMNGGSDADTFVWTSIKDTGLTQATADELVDFNAAAGDLIDLSAIDANVYAAGNQAFTFIGSAAFTLNGATPEAGDVMPGEIRYYHDGGNTFIELQTGTSPDVEAVIRIDGIVTPQASWFVL